MASFSGKGGIAALKAKIRDQGRSLIQEAVLDITENIVDNTPVGKDIYHSKVVGEVFNEEGDLKNNWAINFNIIQNNPINQADVTGSGSIVDAFNMLVQYDGQETIYLTNNMDYADQVENGYPDRPEFGWKSRDGYHFVKSSEGYAKVALIKAARELSK